MKVSRGQAHLISVISKPFTRMTPDQWKKVFYLMEYSNFSFHPQIRKRWKKRYHSSHVWKSKRAKWLQETPYCEKCRSQKKLQIDHLHYDTLGDEDREDIQVICQRCHYLTGKVRRQI
jgi:5-methylcytosine-specific restriction endonuclease McrA